MPLLRWPVRQLHDPPATSLSLWPRFLHRCAASPPCAALHFTIYESAKKFMQPRLQQQQQQAAAPQPLAAAALGGGAVGQEAGEEEEEELVVQVGTAAGAGDAAVVRWNALAPEMLPLLLLLAWWIGGGCSVPPSGGSVGRRP